MWLTGRSFKPLMAPVVVLALGASGCTRSSDRPVAEYDKETGRLKRVTFDANHNGKNDSASIMNGTKLERIELDIDEDHKVDRWDVYEGHATIQYVGLSSRHDGVMDSRAFYSESGALQRIEISTRRDGQFNRVEFYERGVLVRSQEDTDGDGKPDKWESYRPNLNAAAGEPPYAVSSVSFDDAHAGVPQRRIVYDERGRVVRVEKPSSASLDLLP
jgi:hypothetical protein